MPFSDKEGAKAWLESKAGDVRIAIAARTALRVLPIGLFEGKPKEHNGLIRMRRCLTAAVASTRPSPEIDEAAQKADRFRGSRDDGRYEYSGRTALLAAESADRPKSSQDALEATGDALQEAARDVNQLGTVSDRLPAYLAAAKDAEQLDMAKPAEAVFGTRLWPLEKMPTGLSRHIENMQAHWETNSKEWGFWKRWFEGMFEGRPLDWDLQREVALIPDEDWKQGPEHIARLIEEIEARYLATTIAERIELAPSGRLTLVPQDFPEDRHLGLLIDTVRDALDLATSGIRNELPEDAYQVRLLRRTFARYGNDPQRIEMDFERARVSLIEDIAADAIPASAPNRDLVQALSDAAGAIRGSDPEIAQNRERVNRIRLGQVSPEDAARIAEAAEQVAEISEGMLRDDLLEDRFRLPGVRRDAGTPDPVVPLGAAERNAALEAQAAQLRLFSRLAKAWLYLKGLDAEELRRIPGTPTAQWVFGLSGVIGLIVTIVK